MTLKIKYLIIFFLLVVPISFLLSQKERSIQESFSSENSVRQFAPKDAYVPAEKRPYYGSQDPWNRRFFKSRSRVQRGGQTLILDIMEGRSDKVIEFCEEYTRDHPHSNEHLYCLTAAYCMTNQVQKALAVFKKAMAQGMPVERFMAGPRSFFEPLVNTDLFKTYIRQTPQLIHGPLLGNVTDKSASFWIRTFNKAPVKVLLSLSPEFTNNITSDPVWTSKKKDYSAIVTVKNLSPDTKYYYSIKINNNKVIQKDVPSFQTQPKKAKPSQFNVAFGGGAGYNPPHERMWNTIASHHLQAFLFLGDNVYIDLPQKAGPLHNYTYYRRQSRPEFRHLTASTPIYAIWDDHDCAMDDIFFGPFIDKPEWKLSMWHLFRRNWNNPAYGGDAKHPGCWFNFSIADVDFFMLDGRFYRENYLLDNPSMLGPVQKSWLFNALKNSEATFKVLVSPVPWALDTKPLNKSGGPQDTWYGYQKERQEIFSFLSDNHVNGVILLSADRHRSDVRVNKRKNDYPLYEFESSKLTNRGTHDHVGDYLFSYNEKCSFGLLSFNTTKQDPEVTFSIVNIDNQSVYTITLKKSRISTF